MSVLNADPVGVKDIAERLGVKQQTVSQWRYRSQGGLLPDPMPEPRWTVSDQPVWQWADIEKWAKRTGRK